MDAYDVDAGSGPTSPASAADRVVELRVHGVGGTMPEQLLADPHVKRVSGDKDAGFYRPVRPPRAWPPGRHREALSWGGLTSGNALRALWLLLLPFALVNLAGWMHPPANGDRSDTTRWDARARMPVLGALVRLFALTMTVLLVLFVATIVFDLIAYQCGHLAACRDAHWWLAPFGASLVFDQPARRLALATLVPLGALVAVWLAGKRSYSTLERFSLQGQPLTEPADVGLSHPHFWDGACVVGRLRTLHLAGGVAALATALAWAVSSLDAAVYATGAWPGVPHPLAGWLVSGAGAALLCVIGYATARRARPGRALPASFVLLIVALAYALVQRPVLQVTGTLLVPVRRLSALDHLAVGLGVAQLVLLVAMAAVLLQTRDRTEADVLATEAPPDPEVPEAPAGAMAHAFRGFGPVIACALGLLLLAELWAGSGIRVADLLGCPTISEGVCGSGELPLYYAVWYQSAAVAGLALLITVAVGAAVVVARIRRGGERWRSQVLRDFGLTTDAAHERADEVTAAARCYQHSREVRRADRLLLAAVAAAGAVVVTLGGLQLLTALGTGQAVSLWSWLVTAATWTAALVPLAAAALMYAALRQPSTRRGVGVIWDVLTFWPRHHHPFAPPCYGERVVPQLRWRLQRLSEEPGGGRVLLSAHSQGTVIAAAALLQLAGTGELLGRRIVYCSYGSPLIILYRRLFPAYFGGGILLDLARQLSAGAEAGDVAHWQHFYCRTDPLGVRMFDRTPDAAGAEDTGSVLEHRLLDPHQWQVLRGEPPLPLGRHSVYLNHPEMQRTVEEILQMLEDHASSEATAGQQVRLP